MEDNMDMQDLSIKTTHILDGGSMGGLLAILVVCSTAMDTLSTELMDLQMAGGKTASTKAVLREIIRNTNILN